MLINRKSVWNIDHTDEIHQKKTDMPVVFWMDKNTIANINNAVTGKKEGLSIMWENIINRFDYCRDNVDEWMETIVYGMTENEIKKAPLKWEKGKSLLLGLIIGFIIGSLWYAFFHSMAI